MAVRNFLGGINYGARERVIDVEAVDVTTDPEEGARQIEAMKPPALKVGDRVRLTAGGERVMQIIELRDYDNMALCVWAPDGRDWAGSMECIELLQDVFPVRSLVRVEAAEIAG